MGIKIKMAAKIVLGAPFVALFAVLFIMLFGAAGPAVYLMFFTVFFVFGPFLQLLVRKVPQKDPRNQPTPWPQFWASMVSYALKTGAILALFRFAFRVGLSGLISGSDAHNFIFRREADWFFGACGILYAITSFGQEGRWLYQQYLAARELATSTVEAAALGLVELTGRVRSRENPAGPLDPGRVVMSFRWNIIGTQKGPKGETMLGTYDKQMNSFYLEDKTGKILVDPVFDGVELRRPVLAVLSTFFGSRSFEILLTRHIEFASWDAKTYYLKEGDFVYVVGNAELNPKAPPEATGSAGLVVRPREEARQGYESLLQFLAPGKKPARTPHDIFIIADSPEAKAEDLLLRNFKASAAMSLLLAVVSALLIFMAVRAV